ncbi:hypothetical protein ACHAWX_003156 [Stephanocyclus meneghinianus]
MKLYAAPLSVLLGVAHAQNTITITSSSAATTSTATTSAASGTDSVGSSGVSDSGTTSISSVISLHGSGTTNPSKCFWHILDKLEEQIRVPTRLTYRGVGSGTGISEFLGKDIPKDSGINTFEAYNDWGSGDIPIDSEDITTWNNQGIEFVQLPFVLSAVSFFHSIPGVPNGKGGLNMTACLLARVFDGDIKTWDHEDIVAINPSLEVPKEYPIYVGRRVLGSSSTYSITNYLYAQCPSNLDNEKGWPVDKVGSEIEWDESTHECDGSGPMTDCLLENEGAIGYIDSAHGHEEDLLEIALSNADGVFLTAKDAGVEGIQAAAADLSNAPASADGDFSSLAFYNKPGPNTWPITLVSYVYIRKDLPSFMDSAPRRTLLKAFATSLFDPEYIGMCDRYGLIPVPDGLRNLSLQGIELIDVGDSDNSNAWTFETDTIPGAGQGDFVISQKRESFTLYEVDRLAGDVADLKEQVRLLQLELASTRATIAESSGGILKPSLALMMSAGIGALFFVV